MLSGGRRGLEHEGEHGAFRRQASAAGHTLRARNGKSDSRVNRGLCATSTRPRRFTSWNKRSIWWGCSLGVGNTGNLFLSLNPAVNQKTHSTF